MSGEARWYVVHTYSGYENKVASNLMTTVENRNLQDMILEVKVPTEIVTEIKPPTEAEIKKLGDKAKGKVVEVERKLFPGYVFVKMIHTDETWYVVRNIRGCTGFVGPSSEPVPLSKEEVYRMGVETRVIEVSYKVGDYVRLIDCPLDGSVGVVEELDVDKNYVRVLVSMLGRETPVELELTQAEPLND
ncbi:MAG: transcription termination/antitermination factor NusG [Ruminococcaceae bacterium]|nr:transcription termination/antitermination factor NusG [Oscillospiraceae bacterium]